MRLADVIKYASDRLQPEQITLARQFPQLEVQTLGVQGLRFCWRTSHGRAKWHNMPAVPAATFKDAAGAGDWCSAGIIHILAKSGRVRFAHASGDKLLRALGCGQRLAALNCSYEGARGAMYHVAQRDLARFCSGPAGLRPPSGSKLTSSALRAH